VHVQAELGRRFRIGALVTGFVASTVLAILDLVTSVTIVGGLIIGVFIAALAAPIRWVVALGAYSLLLVAILGYDGTHWGPGHWLRFVLVTTGTAVAVLATATRDRYVDALIRTAAVAEVAQLALVRPISEEFDGAEVDVRYVSSAEGALIGGDAYEAQNTPWGVRILIADVCGHGLAAVQTASTIVFAFREAAHRRASLVEVVDAVDESFRRRTTYPDYATCTLLQVAHGQVDIVNCGHPDPLVIGPTTACFVPPPSRSTPLGLGPEPVVTHLVPDSDTVLLLYTDGLTEARDRDGRFFDLPTEAVAAFARPGLGAGLDRLLAALHAHAGESLRDDVVMLAVRLPGAAAP
jgi:phosphoserine phosphatase RsbU/P